MKTSILKLNVLISNSLLGQCFLILSIVFLLNQNTSAQCTLTNYDSGGCNGICTQNGATVEIVKPDLLECQYISTIYWGDGEFIMLDSNDEIPSHTYNGDGVYLLSIEVTAVTEIGDVCQIDVVDQVLIIKDCIVSTDFPNQDRSTIKIYPIPFKDIVNIDFSKNTGGFSLEIFSVMGQLIDEVNIPSNQTKYIYTNQNMVSGTYLFTLKSLDGDITLQSKVIRI